MAVSSTNGSYKAVQKERNCKVSFTWNMVKQSELKLTSHCTTFSLQMTTYLKYYFICHICVIKFLLCNINLHFYSYIKVDAQEAHQNLPCKYLKL